MAAKTSLAHCPLDSLTGMFASDLAKILTFVAVHGKPTNEVGVTSLTGAACSFRILIVLSEKQMSTLYLSQKSQP